MKHTGNLKITAANAAKYKNLTEVTGDLSIRSNAKLDALTSVGGNLYIYSDAKLDALTSVGGSLHIRSKAKLDALTSVGGFLYIDSKAKLDAPALTSVGSYLCIRSKAKLDAPKLYSKGFDNFKVIDNIYCVIVSEKQKDGLTILSCRETKIKDGKLCGNKFYIAKDENNNAHGKTIQEAVQELAFKTASRDVSQFRNMPLTTKKTPQEWAFVYRAITGACKLGTEMFVEGKGKLKKQYTLAEIIEETKGAYGYKRFVEVVR